MSLHDLIYSQQSEPQSPEKSPSPSPRKRRKHQERATILTSQETASDTAALDSFYGISSQPLIPSTTTAPDVIISNGIERRRKRKRGRPKTRHTVHLPEAPVWETVEEAQRRMERTSRKKHYKQIQMRWKQRSHTVQDEVDYGNAVQHMARRVMKKQNRKQPENDDRKPAALSKPQHDIELNSSDEEQQEALGSLWTAMTPQEETDQSDDEEEKVDPNDYRTWDYYQLGYDAPRHDDLKDFYYNHHVRQGNTFQMNYKARQERMQIMESEVTLTPVRKDSIRDRPNERHYLEMDLPTTCHTRLHFHHFTCLRAMAARVLVGSAGKNVELENRLLRDLYSAPSRTVGREYHVLSQAMEHGYDFVVFQSHRWKQRAVAARALGMTTEFHHTGPQHRTGYSLERHALAKAGGIEFRHRLIRLLSDGEVPYEPEATSAANVELVEMSDDKMDGNTYPGSSPMDIDTLQRDNREATDEIDLSLGSSHVEREGGEKDEMKSADVLDETAETSDPDASSFRTFLGCQVDYVHKPGTQPPVPSFPLDESGIVLGGEDQFSHVYHNAKIDDATYSMTMSALLARLGRARLENDKRSIEKIQDQMMTFVDESAQDNVIQLEKFHCMRRKRNEQPSALYYRAMMGLCSFVANGSGKHEFLDRSNTMNVRNASPLEGWANSGSDDDEPMPAKSDGKVDMKVVAQTIHNYCADCPDSTSLTIFPRIHVITALTLIAKNLPASAAEILSRPFDELSHRTPFDIMRKTLEHLEEKNLLVDAHTTNIGEETISVGYLEHVVHQATEIFRQASEIDPTDTLCQAWYVSGLAASLLLCSGNAIDSRVNLSPSSKEREEDYGMLFSASDSLTKNNHEVRQKMSKFSDVRGRIAMAVKKLIQMAHDQNILIGNLIASSTLEWKQLMALLVGPRPLEDESAVWLDARRLHSHFAVQWAIMENSNETQYMVESMLYDCEASKDSMLEFLAKDVENSPSDVLAWKRLAKALGPAGSNVSSRKRKECKQSKCQDCRRLQKGLNVDHALLADESENANGWKKDRFSWWDKHVLTLEDTPSTSATAKEIYCVSKAIEHQFSKEKITKLSFDANQQNHKIDGTNGTFMRCLDEISVGGNDLIYNTHLDYAQNDRIETMMPKTFEERIRSGRQAMESSYSVVCEANGGDDRVELLCYKIMVTCHLYGISHNFISNGIWHLAQECQGETDTIAWRCLVWLSSNGLHIPQILHDLYIQANKREYGQVSPYPREMKEAVRLGVEIFGKEFKQIRDYFDVLKECSRTGVQVSFAAVSTWLQSRQRCNFSPFGRLMIQNIFTSMKKYGEL